MAWQLLFQKIPQFTNCDDRISFGYNIGSQKLVSAIIRPGYHVGLSDQRVLT